MRWLVYFLFLFISTAVCSSSLDARTHVSDNEKYVGILRLKADYATFLITAYPQRDQAIRKSIESQNFNETLIWTEQLNGEKILIVSAKKHEGNGRIVGIYELKKENWNLCSIGLMSEEVFTHILSNGGASSCSNEEW